MRASKPTKTKVAANKVGRPSSFSDAVAATICERLAAGESLRTICKDADMPGTRTVLDWLDVHENFRAKYARAREAQAEALSAEIIEISDLATPETAAVAKLRTETRRWYASKLYPKVFGDRQNLAIEAKVTSASVAPLDYSVYTVEELRTITDLLARQILPPA